MKRILAGALLILAFLPAITVQGPPKARAEAPDPALLRIGLVQTLFNKMPDTIVQMAMKPFKTYLETQTGLTGEVVCGGDAFTLSRKLKSNQIQLAVLHGVEFAWARQKYPSLRPLIIAVNRYPTLQAQLVVHKDARLANYTELEGTIAAVPVQNKEHCRLYFERRCVKPGVAPERFYRRVVTPAAPENALDQVMQGKATATVVDRVVLETYAREHPNRAKYLRVLQESEAFPCGVVAYDGDNLAEATVRLVRNTLVGARDSRVGQEMLQMIRITGFEPVPTNFDAQLTEIVRTYPPPGEAR
jgi:ABC-type phosphate/phosphonate transport system substrate-binding protein